MRRPDLLVLVAGTATDIGKTWVGGQVLAELDRRGLTVAARKPAQSFDPADAGPSDAEVLAAATGETAAEVCPPHRCYPVAMAPPMAAAALGLPAPTTDELLAELRWPDPPPRVGWLETVGGPRSPIADDGDAVTFAEALDADLVVLVADAGLGTVNAVLVSAAALAADRRRAATDDDGGYDDGPRSPVRSDAPRIVVALNRYDADDPLHEANRAWLVEREGIDVTTGVIELADRIVDALDDPARC